MNMDELQKIIDDIRAEVREQIAQLGSLEELKQFEARITGKKGRLGELLSSIGKVAKEQRAALGGLLNSAKQEVQSGIDEMRERLQQAEHHAEQQADVGLDLTLPGRVLRPGGVHPVTAVQWEVEAIFERLGFTIEAGPELESDHYNFEALNIPAWHPARDMQDTFWLTNGYLLRTHTSPVQVRSMEKFGPPLRCIVPGRCFRYETIDASHENTFFQCEGLMIDRGISVANLIAVMKLLLREVFHRDVRIRLRPGYFPFVEPGFELDMNCAICNGSGCPTCKRSGWVEIMPCGMVHPNVLRHGGIDPAEWTGFAFGLGLTRLAMMKYGISDIRVMNSGDLRGLQPYERLGSFAL
ncbi:MAG: Phenylalanine--tRNA ligase alpha subunit [Phycisphaerae bacterium]|nr:Phenylalanine--tRNA ligase alpha subunit [Phycisphaerae bacterium]